MLNIWDLTAAILITSFHCALLLCNGASATRCLSQPPYSYNIVDGNVQIFAFLKIRFASFVWFYAEEFQPIPKKIRPSWTGHSGRPSNEVSVMCRRWSGWNQTQHTTLLSESKSSHSCPTQKQVRGAPSLHNNTRSCDHLICSGSDSFLCTFLLSQKNANKPVQPLLQYAAPHYCMPHHLPRSAAHCEYLFAQTGLLSIHLLFAESSTQHSISAGLCGHQLGAWCSETDLTSPRGPGSPTRPGLRWCTVCRRTPGCCVCSGPPSSGTPGSSCPAGTCSTKHQPPSHQTLCHLKYRK